jgi:methionyl aminopeptidase
MILKKTGDELKIMRDAGFILAEILDKLRLSIKPGLATLELDSIAETLIEKARVAPAFKGYRGFPAATCISVNEEIVHGIPSGRILLEGDIVSVDLGISHRGFFSDAAFTAAVGKIDAQSAKLIDVASKALDIGIKEAVVGKRLLDISSAIQAHVETNGFSVVRDFVGHGIGKSLHEEPEVPNYGITHEGPILEAGMVLAIEPMVNMGSWQAEIIDNGWTAVTRDGKRSAHFEHTVAITPSGPEVLTSLCQKKN